MGSADACPVLHYSHVLPQRIPIRHLREMIDFFSPTGSPRIIECGANVLARAAVRLERA